MKTTFKIALVELPATQGGRLWGTPMKDLYSVVRLPSRAIDLLAAILNKEGYASVKTFNPRYNRYGRRFHEAELKELAGMDVVGISAISRTQPPSFELAGRLKELNPRIRIVFGGPHVSALPDEALDHGDVVVRREGDATFPALMERFVENPDHPALGDVEGISYRDRHGETFHNPDRPFLTSEEISELPFPVYPREVVKGITCSAIVTSRGCPFACDFCSVITHFGRRYRFMDVDRTVELVEHVLSQTRSQLFFGDDNFTAHRTRTKAILDKILSKGISMPNWGAQVRVETSEAPDLLTLMRRAGCTRLYVGFESVNEKTLKLFNKHSSREQNETAIRRFHEAGFSVHGMFVLGSDEDTVETVRQTVSFAKQMMLASAQFFAVTPFPGTPFAARYREEGKIISGNWHLYDAHHVVVRPDQILPHMLQKELERGSLEFYSLREARGPSGPSILSCPHHICTRTRGLRRERTPESKFGRCGETRKP